MLGAREPEVRSLRVNKGRAAAHPYHMELNLVPALLAQAYGPTLPEPTLELARFPKTVMTE